MWTWFRNSYYIPPITNAPNFIENKRLLFLSIENDKLWKILPHINCIPTGKKTCKRIKVLYKGTVTDACIYCKESIKCFVEPEKCTGYIPDSTSHRIGFNESYLHQVLDTVEIPAILLTSNTSYSNISKIYSSSESIFIDFDINRIKENIKFLLNNRKTYEDFKHDSSVNFYSSRTIHFQEHNKDAFFIRLSKLKYKIDNMTPSDMQKIYSLEF